MEDELLDRRNFLAGSTAFGLLGLAGVAPPLFAQDGNARDRALDALLTRWFNEDLAENPTFATGLGLDTGALAPLRGRLGDNSQAKADADRAKAVRRGRELQAFGRRGLSPAGQLNYDIAAFRAEVATIGARFHYGSGGGRPAPYVVSQLGGAYYQVPDFLDTQHPIHDAQDADYYLARLEAFATNLDQETDRIRHDAASASPRPISSSTRRSAISSGCAARRRPRRPWSVRSPAAPPRRISRPIMRRVRRPWSPARSPPRSTGSSPRSARCGRTRPMSPARVGCPTAPLIMPGGCAPTRPPR
jgi:hypothetical protein